MASIHLPKWFSLVLFFFLPSRHLLADHFFLSRYICVSLWVIFLIIWLLYDRKLFIFLEKMKEFLGDQFTTIVTTFGFFSCILRKSYNCCAEIRRVLFISQFSKFLTLSYFIVAEEQNLCRIRALCKLPYLSSLEVSADNFPWHFIIRQINLKQFPKFSF